MQASSNHSPALTARDGCVVCEILHTRWRQDTKDVISKKRSCGIQSALFSKLANRLFQFRDDLIAKYTPNLPAVALAGEDFVKRKPIRRLRAVIKPAANLLADDFEIEHLAG